MEDEDRASTTSDGLHKQKGKPRKSAARNPPPLVAATLAHGAPPAAAAEGLAASVPLAASGMALSSAAAARAATLGALIDEGTRYESSLVLFSDELGRTEVEAAAARARSAHAEAELAAEREAAERVRAELHARTDEQDGLVSRLAASQRVNDEWQERVRSVSSEFEARSAEWQSQLMHADGKWRQIVEMLQARCAKAEGVAASDAQHMQALALENEKLATQLRTAQEQEEGLRGATRAAQSGESERRLERAHPLHACTHARASS